MCVGVFDCLFLVVVLVWCVGWYGEVVDWFGVGLVDLYW